MFFLLQKASLVFFQKQGLSIVSQGSAYETLEVLKAVAKAL